MTDITALDKLIAAVDGGELSVTTPHAGLPSHAMINLILSYRGSLDAAKALHDALLPEWFAGMSQNIHRGDWFAWEQDSREIHFSSVGTDPARAWLIAILKAYRSTL